MPLGPSALVCSSGQVHALCAQSVRDNSLRAKKGLERAEAPQGPAQALHPFDLGGSPMDPANCIPSLHLLAGDNHSGKNGITSVISQGYFRFLPQNVTANIV